MLQAGVLVGVCGSVDLFERSEFLIATSKKKKLTVCVCVWMFAFVLVLVWKKLSWF